MIGGVFDRLPHLQNLLNCDFLVGLVPIDHIKFFYISVLLLPAFVRSAAKSHFRIMPNLGGGGVEKYWWRRDLPPLGGGFQENCFNNIHSKNNREHFLFYDPTSHMKP